MMKYGIRLLFCMGLCALLSVPAYAADYVLSPEDVLEGEISDPNDGVVASGSDAIMLLSSYGSPYDGTISTTYTTYFKGVLEKLPPSMHYALFRPDQYSYRLVYSDDMVYQNGRFMAVDASYVNYYVGNYNSRIQVSEGSEGAFSLSPNGYPVYSDLSDLYPVLYEGVKNYEFKALLFCFAFFILFTIAKSFFSSGHYKI